MDRYVNQLWPLLLGLILVGSLGCEPDGSRVERAGQVCRLASSSMAPRFWGPYHDAHCDECGLKFRVAAEAFRSRVATRCHSCGAECRVDPSLQPGESVAIHPIGKTAPQRFDVIAFQAASREPRQRAGTDPSGDIPAEKSPPMRELVLKRVWGLPGEHIAFEHGELLINGEWLRKDWRSFRQVAIPLHRFPQESYLPWVLETGHIAGENAHGQSKAPLEGTDFASSPISVPPNARLRFAYRRPAKVEVGVSRRTEWLVTSPVLDEFRCNPGISRALLPVVDLGFEIELVNPLEGQFHVSIQYHRRRLKITVNGEESHAGTTASQHQQAEELEEYRWSCRRRCTIAVCDGQLLLGSDVHEPMAWTILTEQTPPELNRDTPLDTASSSSGTLTGIEIVAGSQGLKLSRLATWRDTLLRGNDRVGMETCDFGTLAADQYFVLGDNLPISVDSRHGNAPVTHSQTLGRATPHRHSESTH